MSATSANGAFRPFRDVRPESAMRTETDLALIYRFMKFTPWFGFARMA